MSGQTPPSYPEYTIIQVIDPLHSSDLSFPLLIHILIISAIMKLKSITCMKIYTPIFINLAIKNTQQKNLEHELRLNHRNQYLLVQSKHLKN